MSLTVVVIVAVGITVVVGIIWIAVIGISLCCPTMVASTWIVGRLIPNGRFDYPTGIGLGRRLRKVAVVGIASLQSSPSISTRRRLLFQSWTRMSIVAGTG